MAHTRKLVKVVLDALHHTKMAELCAPVTRGAGIVFMLHHVRPARAAEFAPNRILEITPEFLDAVVRHVLEQGFEPLSLDDVHGRLCDGQPTDRPFVTFTFDDGYRDNRDFALPVLEKYQIPLTVYAASDFADGRGRLWWLTLEEAIRRVDEIAFAINGKPQRLDCRTEQEKAKAFEAVYWQLRPLSDCQVHDVVDGLAAQAGVDPHAACRDLVMDWDELRRFAAHPLVTVGAHTAAHVSLAKYSRAEARRQMQESVARIEAELGVACRHFSYPYGDWESAGPREFDLACKLGLDTGVTTAKGVVPANGVPELHAIPRLSLNGEFQDLRYLNVLLSGLPFALLSLANRMSPARLAQAGRGLIASRLSPAAASTR